MGKMAAGGECIVVVVVVEDEDGSAGIVLLLLLVVHVDVGGREQAGSLYRINRKAGGNKISNKRTTKIESQSS